MQQSAIPCFECQDRLWQRQQSCRVILHPTQICYATWCSWCHYVVQGARSSLWLSPRLSLRPSHCQLLHYHFSMLAYRLLILECMCCIGPLLTIYLRLGPNAEYAYICCKDWSVSSHPCLVHWLTDNMLSCYSCRVVKLDVYYIVGCCCYMVQRKLLQMKQCHASDIRPNLEVEEHSL